MNFLTVSFNLLHSISLLFHPSNYFCFLRPTKYTGQMSRNHTSSYQLDDDCFSYTASYNMFIATNASRVILLLPLSTFILYLGHQQWKKHGSETASTAL